MAILSFNFHNTMKMLYFYDWLSIKKNCFEGLHIKFYKKSYQDDVEIRNIVGKNNHSIN